MKLEPGLVIVIVAVLIFYLRLIIIQRERVRRARSRSPSGRLPASSPSGHSPWARLRVSVIAF